MNKLMPLENPGTLKSCFFNGILGKIKVQGIIAEEIITSFYDELGMGPHLVSWRGELETEAPLFSCHFPIFSDNLVQMGLTR